jgi:hypothetical protein
MAMSFGRPALLRTMNSSVQIGKPSTAYRLVKKNNPTYHENAIQAFLGENFQAYQFQYLRE